MQVPKDANFLNSVLMFNLFCFDAWILISNEESDENNVWFRYDLQNTCGFHLGFHWVSKLMHVTNLAIFYWLSNLWNINEFEKLDSSLTPSDSKFPKEAKIYIYIKRIKTHYQSPLFHSIPRNWHLSLLAESNNSC